MKVYKAITSAYSDVVDAMYITLSPSADLTYSDTIEDTSSGMSVMYDELGEPVGVEVFDFSQKFPVNTHEFTVDAIEPFIVQR